MIRTVFTFGKQIAFQGQLQRQNLRPSLINALQYKSLVQFASKNMAMPALSPTMETGNIMKWVKKEGEKVEIGDVICEVETDKATVGFEVQEPGYLAKIVAPEGTKGVKVGEIVAVIVTKQAELLTYKYDTTASQQAHPAQSTEQAHPVQQVSPVQQTTQQKNVKTYPKHSKLGLPALSPTMEKGNLMNWVKKEGDKVEPGDVLCEIETDKATVGFEVQESGYLAKILVPEGTKDITLGTNLGIIVGKKNLIAQFADYTGTESSVSQATQSEPCPLETSTTSTQTVTQTARERVFASPLARIFANENNINLSSIQQRSGVEGSITLDDVKKFQATQQTQAQVQLEVPKTVTTQPVTPTPVTSTPKVESKPVVSTPTGVTQGIEPNQYQDLELTNMRKTIASRLLESKITIPHYYLSAKVNMDAVLTLREELNKISKVKISVNDYIIKASALALKDVPEVNSQWHGQYIRKFTNSDISIAVSTDAGLITPIVFNAGAKGLSTIAETVKSLADKARKGKLQPKEFQGGTFTISNLGMFGIDQFIAVINPPQAAILAVGKTAKIVVPDESDETKFKIIQQMEVTLSCDHRVVDGAVGAQWLQRFRSYLENPNTMLL